MEFWEHKFRENVKRDQRKRMALEDAGWKVIVIWECGVAAAEWQGIISFVVQGKSHVQGEDSNGSRPKT